MAVEACGLQADRDRTRLDVRSRRVETGFQPSCDYKPVTIAARAPRPVATPEGGHVWHTGRMVDDEQAMPDWRIDHLGKAEYSLGHRGRPAQVVQALAFSQDELIATSAALAIARSSISFVLSQALDTDTDKRSLASSLSVLAELQERFYGARDANDRGVPG